MGDQYSFKGLELVFKAHKSDFHSRNDCLVAAFHVLLSNAGCKSAGVGEEWTDNTGSLSELLPDGWNSNQDVYTLRYVSVSTSTKYLLKVVKAGNSLLINIVSLGDEKAASMSVNTDKYVSESFSDFASTFKNMDELGETFYEEFSSKVFCAASTSSGNPGPSTENNPARRSEPSSLIDDSFTPYSMRQPQRVPFPSVGRGDLDPLAGGFGGGMLLDPRGMGSRSRDPPFGIGGVPPLPRGAVPPGARFDPFGPPSRRPGRRPFQPDPDEFQPPDFENDYIS